MKYPHLTGVVAYAVIVNGFMFAGASYARGNFPLFVCGAVIGVVALLIFEEATKQIGRRPVSPDKGG